jgi:hypothetical protein
MLDVLNSIEQLHFEMSLTRLAMSEVCSAQKGKHGMFGPKGCCQRRLSSPRRTLASVRCRGSDKTALGGSSDEAAIARADPPTVQSCAQSIDRYYRPCAKHGGAQHSAASAQEAAEKTRGPASDFGATAARRRAPGRGGRAVGRSVRRPVSWKQKQW